MALDLYQATLAVGALGTAATGLVDTTKVFGPYGTSRVGFTFIKTALNRLLPIDSDAEHSGLIREDILDTLLANWLNGMESGAQKAAAASFVKLHLNAQSADALAAATHVDPDTLKAVASKVAMAGKPEGALTAEEADTFGRFDLAVAALIDKAYQRADQRYRNVCKTLACVVAVVLAVISNGQMGKLPTWQAVMIGLIATPLAPIAKDLASAIQTASTTLAKVKG